MKNIDDLKFRTILLNTAKSASLSLHNITTQKISSTWDNVYNYVAGISHIRKIIKSVAYLYPVSGTQTFAMYAHVPIIKINGLFSVLLKTALSATMVYFYKMWFGWRVLSLALIPYLLISMISYGFVLFFKKMYSWLLLTFPFFIDFIL